MRGSRYARMGVVPWVVAGIAVLGIGGTAFGDFTFGEWVDVHSVIPGISGMDSIECFSYDGLELYISSWDPTRPGAQGNGDIYVLRRGSMDGAWGQPENLGPGVNSPASDWSVSISSDGLTLYFTSDRRLANSGWAYDIYMTTRATKNDPWGQAVRIDTVSDSSEADCYVWVSPDDLDLYLGRWTPDCDIYVARRATKDSPWGSPVKLGDVVNNSPEEDNLLSLSPDGLLLLFNSFGTAYRPGGYGGCDLWMARRASIYDPWQEPVNLGPQVNGPEDNTFPRISPDGRTFYFNTNTPASLWTNWQVPIMPKLDFNVDGKVDQDDIGLLLDHSGQNYPLCDIGPYAWGDSVVVWQDLAVLTASIQAGGSIPPGIPQAFFSSSPHTHAQETPRDVVLSWTSPDFASAHDVYFGTSFEDVNRADRDHPLGVLVGQGQTATSYDPPGLLDYGQTYYWRVDEVVPSLDSRICKGRVLDFTVEPFSYPITWVLAMASGSSMATRDRRRPSTVLASTPTTCMGPVSMTMWLQEEPVSCLDPVSVRQGVYT